MAEIKQDGFGHVATIVFINHSMNQGVANPIPTVWVCVDGNAYRRAMDELMSMKHISVVSAGMSPVRE